MSASREVDLPGPPPIRWGVLGATARAAQLAVMPALAASPKSRLVAVASRSHPDGTGYDTFGAGRTYGSYEALLADEEVEAVYLPLPNSLHAEWTVRAAEAGKHVLCEKPLATRAVEAAEMAAVCKELGVLLMEAYMTPFHPRSSALADLVKSRRLGPLRFARAAFTGIVDLGADDFRSRPETGGGALLDLGVYCLAPLLAIGRQLPAQVASGGMLARSGVDASFSGWMDFDKGFTASFECSFETPARQNLEIVGRDGWVTVDRPFTPGPEDTQLQLGFRDGTTEIIDAGGGDAYRGMVDHVAAVLRDSADLRRTPEQSVELLGLIDRLREAAAWAW
ncbi:MAG TPA: Gfo/Idh/MocA family oxidoreductase [Acidimicrobiales bacterium]|nr:Gfo/Idh/MocA family oxidoreductase [Acidimicrobiales bacterium]